MNAVLQADRDIYGGAHLSILKDVFDQRGFFYYDEESGSISSNTTWSGSKHITGNVTVNNGVTLTISPNTFLFFDDDVSLTVNGTLNANGTSGNPITFTSSSTWEGLKINGSASLSYSNINNAYKGVYCNDIGSTTISHCTIEDCYYGIYTYSTSLTLNYNTISDCRYGIYAHNGTITKSYTKLYDNLYYGVYGYYTNCYYNDHNVLRVNGYGNRIRGSLLLYSGDDNCLHDNVSYAISATDNSTVVIEDANYWGHPFTLNDLYISSNSDLYIDYPYPYLSSDPNNCPLSKNSNNILAADNNFQLSNYEEFEDLFTKEREGKYEEAIAGYESEYNKEQDEDRKKRILIRIAKCYENAVKEDFGNFLDEKIRNNLNSKDEIYAFSTFIEGSYLIGRGDSEKAIEVFTKVINNYDTDEELHKHALYNLGVIYYNQGDGKGETKAEEYFVELKNKYPEDDLTLNAMIMMGDTENLPSISQELKKVEDENVNLPEKTTLLGNYPNPFNPSTVIKYQLTEASNVTIKIYDMLGREIGTLVNSTKTSGIHSVNFNTSEFGISSGVYIYRMEATSLENSSNYLVQSKRMLFVK